MAVATGSQHVIAIDHAAPNVEFPARAFGLTPVYETIGGSVIGHLAPDSVHRVRARGDWLLSAHGLIARTDMQPIADYKVPMVESQIKLQMNTPFWAELIAPSSLIRGWCSGGAPVLTKLGYGAVVPVIGALTVDDGSVWYKISQGRWALAEHFARLPDFPTPIKQALHMVIDRRAMRISLYAGRNLRVQSAFCGGSALLTLTTSLHVVQPGDRQGTPWLMRLECGANVLGVYWHNRFGCANAPEHAQPDIQLPVYVAKAIYAAIDSIGCTVTIET